MPSKRKTAPAHPQPGRRGAATWSSAKTVPSTYQILHIAHNGKTVTLCLMHGGSYTNFKLRNIPVDSLVWLD